ncbi:hypothetical protein JOC37_000956 [Desulfohalotomaculum tongense]|uniref:hypothetical protein n=1 Tax=Desulforadius tongensis TaxID=1216062 RepID=UPI001958383B|nr:hypothetical protein [Desulforadius tongensis]MBM7854583.1 hypothetical protein [Desulforadius tongensis]
MEQRQEVFQRVRKHFTLMLAIECLGSMLGQIGFWKAGESTLVLVVGLPLFIFLVGNHLIKTKLTEERAVKLSKYIPLLYCFLVLVVVGNIMSFLVKIGFFKV